MTSKLRQVLLCAVLAAGCGDDHDPAPTVAIAEVIRGGFTLEREGHEERVVARSRVENEAEAITAADGRGAVSLDSGAWILFDHDTRGRVKLAELALSQGRVWVDA